VPGENGIRGSKDLRAEIGKFPNSTNERKKMSKKTLRKRIAVVAVSALTAGILSVATSPVANAASPLDLLRDEMTASTTVTQGSNVGVCYVASSTLDNADATNTVEMLSTGIMTITGTDASDVTNGHFQTYTITGPANWSAWTNATTTGMAGVLVDSKTLKFTSATTLVDSPSALVLRPSGVGTAQVTIRVSDGTTTTLVEIITIAIKATCGSGKFSAADSGIALVPSTAKSSAVAYADITNTDTAGANVANNEGAIYVRVDSYDINGIAVTEAVSVLSAEVSSGAVVAWGGTGTINTAYSTSNAKAGYFQVEAADTTKAWSGTITIKLDGAVVATKSAKIVGIPATITISGQDILQNNATNAQGGDYVVKDAEGNELAVAVNGWDTLTAAQSKVITVDSAPGAGNGRTPAPYTPANILAGTTKGQFDFACNSNVGPGQVASGVRLKYTNSALVSIFSAPFDITCGGAPYTYTASLDKASYVPGDVAVLTITAKDAYGNAVYDAAALGTSTNGVNISGSNLTPVATPTYSDTFTSSVKTYRFTVGSTGGSYNLVVDLVNLNSSSKPQSALAVPYTIKTSGTTNEDILKSIVSLIASINKQIQALQKLILKRR
jgi:hypothetical protein